ncbi:MAG: aminoacyl-tRNA hydrolase [Winogradskyella sp.]|uniref:alternative ribosome rescue aminoacyl-tRNA hydrolase ArfB n=1 Tax=Winogradskyella sp. TaxID=1883156 RepID=UPI0017A1A69C|nr:aminoacyl-tRNA hydrolase [Winogradskyella sp.]
MDVELLKSEVTYKYSRSSGSGGQHVNKVSSKAELYFDILNSKAINEYEKEKLSAFYNNRINNDGVLVLTSEESRSQFRNKAIVTQRFLELIEEGLKEKKTRIPTKISKAAKRKRLANKRKNADKKANRKPPEIE